VIREPPSSRHVTVRIAARGACDAPEHGHVRTGDHADVAGRRYAALGDAELPD
jgi:hypothetical protein